jgi:hypothetical protein
VFLAGGDFAAAAAERADVRALFALAPLWGTVGIGGLGLYRLAPGALTWRSAAIASLPRR